MKISYTQLQTYLEDKLPTGEKLAEAFAFHAFEIESIEKVGDDTVLDIKVLPDRACYAKSYEGIAREVSAILGLKKNADKVKIPAQKDTILVSISQINEVLGSDISQKEAVSILSRMDINVTEKGDTLLLGIPGDRLDLQSWRDIPEEVGRIYGYDKIKSILPKNTTFKPVVEKTFYYVEKIKNILVEKGFSEVITYTLSNKGDFRIEKSASDKNYLRTNLTDGIVRSLELNYKNADLLSLDEIKIFEIGKVFPKTGEYTSLCVGIKNLKKKDVSVNEKIRNTREHILEVLGSNIQTLCTIDDTGGLLMIKNKQIGIINNIDGVLELNLDALIASLPDPLNYDDLNFLKAPSFVYNPFSLYPYIVRDIALWAESGSQKDIEQLLQKESGELMVKLSLFDTFEKDSKTSYGFRMIFQAMDRTLLDTEVNVIMEHINDKMKEKGWVVR